MRNYRFLSALTALPMLFAVPALAVECTGEQGSCDVDAHNRAEAAAPVERGDVANALLDALEAHPELRQQLARMVSKGIQENQEIDHAAAVERAMHDETAPFVGNKDGKVVIVEYFDNRCPYCKALAPLLARALAEYPDVKLVYKEFAVLGPQSQAITRAALASQKQGKYLAFHDELMRDPLEEKDPFTDAHLFEVAQKAGLDVAMLKTDMASGETSARMTALANEGRVVGIHGTPGLLINGKIVSVVAGVTADQFKATGKIIDEAKTYENIKAAIFGARAARDKAA